tara:strand:+ start:518 stop:835 length:318 start_codon:yes stop_codon:yes gene_type:complete
MKKRDIFMEVINKMLLPYQITIQDILDEYPTNKIDGLEWYEYFYVPREVQQKILAPYIKKRQFHPIWYFTLPTEIKNPSWLNEEMKDPTLINNRNKIIEAYERVL